MNNIPLKFLLLFFLLVSLIGCASGDPSSSSSLDREPAAPSQPTAEPVTAPQKAATPSSKPEPPTFSHRSPRDTVDWESTNISKVVPVVNETNREWPGERLGLIGPIIARGGVGSKSYVTVYDSAGVLIGGMTLAEYKKTPKRLEELLQKAQIRSEHQNFMAMRYLLHKRLAAEAAAIQKEQGGRHENQ